MFDCFNGVFLQFGICQGNIIAKKIIPTVVLIVIEDDNGQMLGLGSGFVSKDIIATNFHVIENASRGYVKLVKPTKQSQY